MRPNGQLAEPDHPFDDEGRPTAPAAEASARHDHPQLDAAYRDHAGWLVAFLRRRFSARDAEDLAQETFVRAAGAQVTLRNPRGFLARVALRVVQDDARRQAARPTFAPEDAAPDPATDPDQAEAVLLKEVVLSLPPKLREVFLLSRFHGLTYEEIARRCNLSVKTVEARMTRALAMCVARLRD
ncbi:RNA polymerase sigma-70 factor, ECF subfamily [Phenylobacterium zucineum HLK1]|uniref:RNA polymerase sigma-70 factor, ECF subfamily n=1 Tax=Phenylobacterium zucineum (strain HLK1) TaxID=450851 RepID=B4RFZ0_PHEZH|nr:RNA polymerase sigma factor [Phenylobacterium zucineum]ACG78803.1 RNA polymerase sigma-70 factor, ECF subfamily [Phenylobacterium zucineum HLK1]